MQSTNANSPGATPKSEVANISNNRIPQKESTVNNNIAENADTDTESNKNYIAADKFGKVIRDFTEGKITADEFYELAQKIDESRVKYLDRKHKTKYRTERSGFKP